MNVSGLAMLDSVTSRKSGGSAEYTIVIGKGMNSVLEGVLGTMDGAEGPGMNFGKITAVYTVDSKGMPKKVVMQFTASMTVDVPGEDGQTVSTAVDYAYDMTMTVKATGKDVNVTFPDFSGYQEIDPSQMTGIAA